MKSALLVLFLNTNFTVYQFKGAFCRKKKSVLNIKNFHYSYKQNWGETIAVKLNRKKTSLYYAAEICYFGDGPHFAVIALVTAVSSLL